MPKHQTTAQQRARQAARGGGKYTQALREATGAAGSAAGGAAPDPGEPGGSRYGGHAFDYEPETDLFRCSSCRVYEVAATADDGSITPCVGMVGFGGDTERVYLLLTANPALPSYYGTALAGVVRETGLGRAPRFSYRDGRMLIETAPSVVDQLARRIDELAFTRETPFGDVPVRAVTGIEHLTAEQGRAVLAENYAAYVADYGEPA
ncbi:hypothetical protein ACSNOI_03300 [Actinomadura kijaniata]|uniref:hypothetical protein n=1 Tax=Actinomadura kijaniata TaxID=46161 RepID=UPI003F19ED61